MTNLEQTIEKSVLGRVKNYAGRIRNSAVSKIVVCSLAGILSAGLGYGCGEEDSDSDVPPTYKSVCHEIVATCNPNSDCTQLAKAMINQNYYSQCSELKSQCQCH